MKFVNLKSIAAVSLALAVATSGAETNPTLTADLNQVKGPRSTSNLSRETVADLQKVSAGAPAKETSVTVTSSGEFVTSLPVREDDVYFLSLGNENRPLNRT